jgi:CRP-like cAMP-binding protein
VATTAEVLRSAGSELTREGYPGESFIVIVTGRALVEMDGQRVRELGAGEYLGGISLIDGGPRTATVTALEAIGPWSSYASDSSA